MAFDQRTWVVGDSFTPAEANRIEQGIEDAHSVQNVGIVQIDSFSGANDTAKLNNYLTYARAQTRIPWGQLPARDFNTGSNTFNLASGDKFLAPGLSGPTRNAEISDRKLVPGTWRTTCGNGSSSLLQSTGTTYNTHFSGIVFHGDPGSQIFRSTVNSYTAELSNLTFYGCRNGVGNPSEKWLGTQFRFTGHWTSTGHTNTVITIGGGDADLAFYINCNSGSGSAGNPNIIFDGLSKSTVWYLYVTAEGDAVGLQIKGNLGHDVAIFGGVFEGRSASNVATRPVIDVQGGTVVLFGPDLGQVSDAGGNVLGVIHQSGGDLTIFHPTYRRGSGANAYALPILWQTGGVASVHDPVCLTAGEEIRIRYSDGVLRTVPRVNRLNGLPVGAPFAVSGSRAGNAALASLIAAAASAGIITDGSSA